MIKVLINIVFVKVFINVFEVCCYGYLCDIDMIIFNIV